MSKKQYVNYSSSVSCSTEVTKQITGCRFTLSPMSDNYISIILNALKSVDTSKIWSKSDKLSTVYRGKRVHVQDALKRLFIHSYTEGIHMNLEATFSKGCPGDTEGESLLDCDDILVNEQSISSINFPVECKIALYPLGEGNYMDVIAHVVNSAIDSGLYSETAHYCTFLKGDVHSLFSYIDFVNEYCGSHLDHYVFEVTMAVNLPE
jgi:uncharacterized protein YqgV (UPF0045/DUF77 family)